MSITLTAVTLRININPDSCYLENKHYPTLRISITLTAVTLRISITVTAVTLRIGITSDHCPLKISISLTAVKLRNIVSITLTVVNFKNRP